MCIRTFITGSLLFAFFLSYPVPTIATVTSPLQAKAGRGLSLPPASRRRPPSTFSVLYNFGQHGGAPSGDLIAINGLIYGATFNASGLGSVFDITPTGVFSTLYNFRGIPDGAFPTSGVIAANGNLFGETGFGGIAGNNRQTKYGCGTVYELNAQGAESVIAPFTCGSRGYFPANGLVSVGGALYGTTQSGTVFVVKNGQIKTLHHFKNYPDGASPRSGMLFEGGTLYGTTFEGGINGLGTVFSITPSGTETVVHNFSSTDGAYPNGSLIDFNGTFYGVTQLGGAFGKGTVFSITPTGVETIIYSFAGAPDGMEPSGRLVFYNGSLYGTTSYGGASGYGTVFQISSGNETILHSFTGIDGAEPLAGMTILNGILYGSTQRSGAPNYGGTIFQVIL